MPTAPVLTHAFDFYYKRIPTGSGAITSLTWSQQFISGAAPNSAMSASWYNFPLFGVNAVTGSILTRHTSTISTKDGALAWGSAASDLLWNVLTPSMSISQSTDGLGRADTQYRFSFNSESLCHREFKFPGNSTYGVAVYPITSSWIAYEPRMIQHASGSTSTGYRVRGDNSFVYFPATAYLPQNTVYSLPISFTPPTTTFPNVGQNPPNIAYGLNSTGSNDGRFFDLAGGCGITRTSISASLVAFAVSASATTVAARNFCTAELKKRRLFFPTVRNSGSVAVGNAATWVYLATGKGSSEFFTENGGIYNVKFTLKRDVSREYYPDTAGGSELLVYLHNINTTIPAPSGRVAGASGWYPPEANIVRIKNDPAMAFLNPSTGYLIETFNINLVQYGTPAQLVFEVTGSLANNAYFGCIVDDVEFCKVGVTTDPSLIKQTTIGDALKPAESVSLDDFDS